MIVALTAANLNCSGQNSISALDSFKHFAARQESMFLRVKSCEMNGTIKITISDEYLKRSPGPKVTNLTFNIWAQGDQLKEVVKYLDGSGAPVRTVVYYLSPTQVAEVDDLNGVVGKIFPLGVHSNDGLFNFCPFFLEYSFLNPSITRSGIPALLLSDLASKARWDVIINDIRDVKMEDSGLLRFNLIEESQARASVDLIKSLDQESIFQISAITFLTKDGYPDRKIEVMNMSHNSILGDIGKTFKVGVYRLSPDKPSITWEYNIQNIKLNSPINDEIFEFDPSSVDEIFDGKNKKFIDVPK